VKGEYRYSDSGKDSIVMRLFSFKETGENPAMTSAHMPRGKHVEARTQD
jgi:hypothetical protein